MTTNKQTRTRKKANFCSYCGEGLIYKVEEQEGIHIGCFKKVQWSQYSVLNRKDGTFK